MMTLLGDGIRRSPIAAPLAAGVAFLRTPRVALRLAADARETRRNVAFMRQLPRPARGAPRVLVLSMSNGPYGVKIEGMLGHALRRRGWRVAVLTSRAYTAATRLFAHQGISDFVYFEDLLSRSSKRGDASAEIARRASEPMDFQSVMAWSYHDAWIGPQILSSASRRRFDGAPDPNDPEVRQIILSQLPVSIGFVHAAEDYLAEHKPDLIIVNEPNYHVLGPFVDVAIARGIPVIHYTQPSRDDALVFKKLNRETRRIHPNSITHATLRRLLEEPWTGDDERLLDEEFEKRYGGVWRIQSRNQPDTREIAPDELRAELGLDPAKPTAVLFSHVLWDANLFYGQDLFENYGEWFIESVKAAVANPRLNWIVKLHPANVWKRQLSGVTDEYGEVRLIREHVGELPGHVKLLRPETKISTLSLFRMIDVGITVRGSIGYELPCFGVPVVTAGTGRYSGFGFTVDHESRGAYLATLARAETLPRLDEAAVHTARVHAHALLARRPWAYRSFRTDVGSDNTDPLNQNLTAVVESDADVTSNGDLDRFADWAPLKDDVDYLETQGESSLGDSAVLAEWFGPRFLAQTTGGSNNVSALVEEASGKVIPISGGIPRFVSGETYSDAFGLQWNTFKSTQLDSRSGHPISFRRFWENTRWRPRDVHGKRVLEAGSGAGRFTEILLDAGARVATFDLSSAIEANHHNNKNRGEAVFFRADIYDIPCPDNAFDFVFCYGVLQHTPDPDSAFRELVRKVKPQGRISVDFYLKTDRLDPFYQPKYFWRRWTVAMPPEKLLARIRAYMPYWLPIDTLIRRIPYLGPKVLAILRVPCWNYTRSGLSREQRLEWAILDTFDALSAHYDKPRSLDEVQAMAAAVDDLVDVEVFYGSNGVVLNARRR